MHFHIHWIFSVSQKTAIMLENVLKGNLATCRSDVSVDDSAKCISNIQRTFLSLAFRSGKSGGGYVDK